MHSISVTQRFGEIRLYTKTPTYFGINSYTVLKQEFLRLDVPASMFGSSLDYSSSPLLRRRHFQIYYVNGEKKHNIVKTAVLANIFWSVFSFTVYIPGHKTQGQVLTKEMLSHTRY